MPKTAHLTDTVYFTADCWRGREIECAVEVEFSFDGDEELQITKAVWVEGNPELIPNADDALWDAVWDIAQGAYDDWRTEYEADRADHALGMVEAA
ncbi:hypothetical protein GTZ99_12325 [Novosphingobium sp. FSY-8]|uniref:DUF1488 family protein n=1 Tax=Novosphingobium ovatum TaxID=1908523 RepID=A0ABW9XFN8_9SPHN|nr:hypothetical protein [Novosphingobium ovatum]NBC37336.1 hypothetical protein [Novosphingobium ovatum]